MLRLLGWLFGFGVFCALGAVAVAAVYLNQLNSNLPDYTVLKDYQPPVTTRIHAADGTLLAEYARERRLFQPRQNSIEKGLLHLRQQRIPFRLRGRHDERHGGDGKEV